VDGRKIQANAMCVTGHLKRVDPNCVHHVTYLDSEAGLTTFGLSSAGWAKHQLHCPNINENFLAQTPRFFRNSATSYESTIYEWMRDLDREDEEEKKINYHVLMDLCCSFDGNKTYVRPKSDITVMLAKKLLPLVGGICWMTFSMRGVPKKETKEFIQWVKDQASLFGYNFKLAEKGTYAGFENGPRRCKMLYLFWETV
jgi:hypothetical protein